MNEQGKQCPACGRDIGMWAIIKAPLPTMISCPHCKTAIQYDESGWGLVLIGFIMCLPVISIIASSMNFIYTMNIIPLSIIVITISVLVWLPFELLMVLYLRRNQKLIIKSR